MIATLLVLVMTTFFAFVPAVAQESDGPVARGRGLFFEQGCNGCHTLGAIGTPIAVDLSRIGAKYPEEYLRRWLRDPSLQKPTAHMPKIDLTEEESQALAAFLASLPSPFPLTIGERKKSEGIGKGLPPP